MYPLPWPDRSGPEKQHFNFFHLVKNILYFPMLVLEGIYHYWICFIFFRGTKKQMDDFWEILSSRQRFELLCLSFGGFGSVRNYAELIFESYLEMIGPFPPSINAPY